MIKQDVVRCTSYHGYHPVNSERSSSLANMKDETLSDNGVICEKVVTSVKYEKDVGECSLRNGVTENAAVDLAEVSSYCIVENYVDSDDSITGIGDADGGDGTELCPLIGLTAREEFPDAYIKMAFKPQIITGVFSAGRVRDGVYVSEGMAGGGDFSADSAWQSFSLPEPGKKYKTRAAKVGTSARLEVEDMSKPDQNKSPCSVKRVLTRHSVTGKTVEKYMRRCVRSDMKSKQKVELNFREKMRCADRGLCLHSKTKTNSSGKQTSDAAHDAADVRTRDDCTVIKLDPQALCPCKQKSKWRKCRCSQIIKSWPSAPEPARDSGSADSGCDQVCSEDNGSSEQSILTSKTGRKLTKSSHQRDSKGTRGKILGDSFARKAKKGIRGIFTQSSKFVGVRSRTFLREKYGFALGADSIRAESPSDATGMNRRCCLMVEMYAAFDESRATVKTHACARCRKCFASSQSLKSHLRQHTGDLRFTCEVCGKRYSCSSVLVRHKLKHMDGKSYTCQECGKCFSLYASWHRHQVVHSGVRRYTCQVCQKKFMWKACLNRHAVVHTGGKPFHCEICQGGFANKSSLRRHRLTVHRD